MNVLCKVLYLTAIKSEAAAGNVFLNTYLVMILQRISLYHRFHLTPQEQHNIQNQVCIWLHLLHRHKHTQLKCL